jgi:CRP-like cAMP-binding protein
MHQGLWDFLNQFIPLSDKEFEELMSRVEECSFDKNVKLTDIGQIENYMYFIVQGLARKYFINDKEEVHTQILAEGGMIGSELSFFTGKPSKYIVETLEPTIAYRISKDQVEKLYQSGKKWEKFGRIITAHYFIVLEYRLLDNVRYSTRERFLKFIDENPELVMRVPQKYLASYLDIKPETFSRMKHFVQKKA